jgi:hypothetical protein
VDGLVWRVGREVVEGGGGIASLNLEAVFIESLMMDTGFEDRALSFLFTQFEVCFESPTHSIILAMCPATSRAYIDDVGWLGRKREVCTPPTAGQVANPLFTLLSPHTACCGAFSRGTSVSDMQTIKLQDHGGSRM